MHPKHLNHMLFDPKFRLFVFTMQPKTTNSKTVKDTCHAPLPVQERNPMLSPKSGDLWIKNSLRICVGDVGKSIACFSNFNYNVTWYIPSNFVAFLKANEFVYEGNVL